MSHTPRSPARRVLRGVLIVIAVQVAALAAGRALARRLDTGEVDDDEIRRTALMNGVDIELTSQSFRHGRVDLGMGGVNIDLTRAALAPEGATIEVHGAMGGLNVQVPEDWRVTAESDSRTTGLNVTASPADQLSADAPHLHVVSHAKMSGVNVEAL
ncbi:MAG: LiaF domain-containing protein [Actinomycetes bacterium]